MPRRLETALQVTTAVVLTLVVGIGGFWLWEASLGQRPMRPLVGLIGVAAPVLVGGFTLTGVWLTARFNRQRDQEAEWRQAEIEMIRELVQTLWELRDARLIERHAVRRWHAAVQETRETHETTMAHYENLKARSNARVPWRRGLNPSERTIVDQRLAVSSQANNQLEHEFSPASVRARHDVYTAASKIVYVASALTDDRFYPAALALREVTFRYLNVWNQAVEQNNTDSESNPPLREAIRDMGEAEEHVKTLAADRTRSLRLALMPNSLRRHAGKDGSTS